MTDKHPKRDEDRKSLDEVLRQGKKSLSDIEIKHASKLRKEQEEEERKRQQEENRLRRIGLSQENVRVIPGTSAIPIYSLIDRELLHNRGVLFDWVRQDLKTHWDYKKERPDVDMSYYEINCNAHRLIYFMSGITLPNKGRVITYIPIEEQIGKTHFNIHQDRKGPYRSERAESFLGSVFYRKEYVRPDLGASIMYLDEERKMYVCSQRDEDVTSFTPQSSPCKYKDGISVSLGDDKDTIYINWSKAIIKHIEKIY